MWRNQSNLLYTGILIKDLREEGVLYLDGEKTIEKGQFLI